MSKSKLSYWKNHPGSAILRFLVWLSAIITGVVLFVFILIINLCVSALKRRAEDE